MPLDTQGMTEKLREMSFRFPFVSQSYFVKERLALWSFKPDSKS